MRGGRRARLPPYRVCRYGSVGGLNIHTYIHTAVCAHTLLSTYQVGEPTVSTRPGSPYLMTLPILRPVT